MQPPNTQAVRRALLAMAFILPVLCGGSVTPLSAVSRKIHGAAGAFDVSLPLTGPAAIECRSGGTSGDHQVVVTFATPVTFVGATVAATASASVSGTGVSGSQVVVNLTGVTNGQEIVVTLSGVNDGSNTGNVSVPMALLAGDTNGSGVVTSSDVSQTGAQIGQPLTTLNFRFDVNVNGTINASDKSFVKSTSGTGLTLVDTDGDRVPDTRDGWPLHKQLSTPPVPEVRYAVIKLGTEGGVQGMNNLGDVVGAKYEAGLYEAMVWQVGQSPRSLGFLTQDGSIQRTSFAFAINDAGQVAGFSTYSWDPNVQGTYPNPPTSPVWSPNYNVHAFIWQADTGMRDLNDLSLAQPPSPSAPDSANKGYSESYSINQAGIPVGRSCSGTMTQSGWTWFVVNESPHAASFSGTGSPVDLGIGQPPGETSEASAINDRGDLAGTGAGDGFAAYFKANGQTKIIGNPAANTWVTAMNNSGHVVGKFGPYDRAPLWVDEDALDPSHSSSGTDERFLDLHAVALEQGFTYSSYVEAINDRDQMVGIVGEGVIWQNGKMQKLRNLIAIDTFVQSVAGINKHGMIAANAASAPDYNLGPVLLVPLEFRARDGRINYGFDPPLKGDPATDPPVPDDPASEPPWGSAVCGTSSDNIKLVLPGLLAPKIKLAVVEGAEFIDLSPSDTPLSNGETTLVLSGSSAVFATPETAEIEAQLVSNSDKASNLKVLVLPERIVSVGIYRVTDPDSPATSPVEGPTNSEIIAALDDIYKQAGVKFYCAGIGSPPRALRFKRRRSSSV